MNSCKKLSKFILYIKNNIYFKIIAKKKYYIYLDIENIYSFPIAIIGFKVAQILF